MRTYGIQPANSPSFGTRYGRNLARFIENNKEILSNQNFKNLSRIRNNGIDSVLELEHAPLKYKETAHSKYILTLTGGAIDKKNEIMKGYDDINYRFNDYIMAKYAGKAVSKNDRFPIHIKNLGKDTNRLVAKQFDDQFLLAETIEKEYEQAKIVEKEFPKFKQDYLDK